MNTSNNTGEIRPNSTETIRVEAITIKGGKTLIYAVDDSNLNDLAPLLDFDSFLNCLHCKHPYPVTTYLDEDQATELHNLYGIAGYTSGEAKGVIEGLHDLAIENLRKTQDIKRSMSVGDVSLPHGLGGATASNIMLHLALNAAETLPHDEIEWIRKGASEIVEVESRNLSTVLNGLACLVAADDHNAGNFQNGKEVSSLLFSVGHQLEVINGFSMLAGLRNPRA